MVNGSELELRDAILIDRAGRIRATERWLGTIAAGAAVEIDGDRTAKAAGAGRRGPGSRRRTRSWRRCGRTGKPARRTRASSAWSPGCRDDRAGRSSSRPSTGSAGSRRSWSICAAARRPAPTGGGTTGSPPAKPDVEARLLEHDANASGGAAGATRAGATQELPPATDTSRAVPRPRQADDQSRLIANDGAR